MARTLSDDELTDAALPMSEIAWRLFHEDGEIRVLDAQPVSKGCRCDLAHIRGVLSRFPAEERAQMADADGIISVDCAFCSHIFPVALAELSPAA